MTAIIPDLPAVAPGSIHFAVFLDQPVQACALARTRLRSVLPDSYLAIPWRNIRVWPSSVRRNRVTIGHLDADAPETAAEREVLDAILDIVEAELGAVREDDTPEEIVPDAERYGAAGPPETAFERFFWPCFCAVGIPFGAFGVFVGWALHGPGSAVPWGFWFMMIPGVLYGLFAGYVGKHASLIQMQTREDRRAARLARR